MAEPEPVQLPSLTPSLSPDVTDAILEIFNVGVGRAAAVLSELGNAEVVLSIPYLAFLDRDALIVTIANGCQGRISGIRQAFTGGFDGDALLIFPERESLDLARALIPDPDSVEDMSEMEREALLEVGNIVLNACISSLADLLHADFDSDIPNFFDGEPNSISHHLLRNSDGNLMYLRIDFGLKNNEMKGHIVFVLDLRAADAMRTAVEAILRSITDPSAHPPG